MTSYGYNAAESATAASLSADARNAKQLSCSATASGGTSLASSEVRSGNSPSSRTTIGS